MRGGLVTGQSSTPPRHLVFLSREEEKHSQISSLERMFNSPSDP